MKKQYSSPDILIGKSENLIVRCKRGQCSGSSTYIWGNFTEKEEMKPTEQSSLHSA